MNVSFPRWQTIGGVVSVALLGALISLCSSHLSSADDSSASKSEGFSPYVTKDGGISLPADYREKFLHLGTWAVATKPFILPPLRSARNGAWACGSLPLLSRWSTNGRWQAVLR